MEEFNKRRESEKKIIDNSCGGKVFLTIAIPTYKRKDFLRRAISSCAVLNDYCLNFSYEIIVYDNDPSTSLEDVADLSNINNLKYVVNLENVGMFSNWNKCILGARGEWITILNDDDLFVDGWVSEVALKLESCNSLSAFMFKVELNDLRSEQDKFHRNRFAKILSGYFKLNVINSSNVNSKMMFFQNIMYGSLGVFFRKDAALKIKKFDSKYYPVSDWDYWFSWIAYHGDIAFFSDSVIAKYTIQSNESMKPEVLEKFSSVSRQMRVDWLSDYKDVLPACYRFLVFFLEKYENRMHVINFSKPGKSKIVRFFKVFEFYFYRLIFLFLRKIFV